MKTRLQTTFSFFGRDELQKQGEGTTKRNRSRQLDLVKNSNNKQFQLMNARLESTFSSFSCDELQKQGGRLREINPGNRFW